MATIGYTGTFVTYTAQSTGTYDIVAYGAQGGNPTGGLGAEIGGNFTLTAGETLTIAVSGRGGSGGSGGGGSFVYVPAGSLSPATPLAVAGGDGGSGTDLTYSYSNIGNFPSATANGQAGTSGGAGTGFLAARGAARLGRQRRC